MAKTKEQIEKEETRKRGEVLYCTSQSIGVIFLDYDQIIRVAALDDELYSVCLEDENNIHVCIPESEIKKYQKFLKGELTDAK